MATTVTTKVDVSYKYRDLEDVHFGSPAHGDVAQWDAATDRLVFAPPAAGPKGDKGDAGLPGVDGRDAALPAAVGVELDPDATVKDALNKLYAALQTYGAISVTVTAPPAPTP